MILTLYTFAAIWIAAAMLMYADDTGTLQRQPLRTIATIGAAAMLWPGLAVLCLAKRRERESEAADD